MLTAYSSGLFVDAKAGFCGPPTRIYNAALFQPRRGACVQRGAEQGAANKRERSHVETSVTANETSAFNHS